MVTPIAHKNIEYVSVDTIFKVARGLLSCCLRHLQSPNTWWRRVSGLQLKRHTLSISAMVDSAQEEGVQSRTLLDVSEKAKIKVVGGINRVGKEK